MQPTFSSSRILFPVRPWFIFLSLASPSSSTFPHRPVAGMPDCGPGALLLVGARIPPGRHGLGLFLLGIVMDVADGAVLGQHSLAYVLLAYVASSLSRRILWFPPAAGLADHAAAGPSPRSSRPPSAS